MQIRTNLKILAEILAGAAKLSAMLLSVRFRSITLDQFVDIASAPQEILDFVAQPGLSPWVVIGVVLVMAVEISFITPPIGMNVDVIKWVLPDVLLAQIYRGFTESFITEFARPVRFVNAPGIVLWLVRFLT